MIPISQGGQRLRAIEHDAFLEEYSVGRIAAPAPIALAASDRHAREARRRLTFAAVLLAPSCSAGSCLRQARITG